MSLAGTRDNVSDLRSSTAH